MKSVFRWFTNTNDSISLNRIKQIPGISGVATCLIDIPVGEVWPVESLRALKDEINSSGLEFEVVESLNVHEDIKKGLPTRDRYIDNYIKSLFNLSKIGVKCVCYNFMPVFDWLRTDLFLPMNDGSCAMAYRHDKYNNIDIDGIVENMQSQSSGYWMPGWEPEKLPRLKADIEYYGGLPKEQYWNNLKYFLDAIMPYAEKYDINMAVHPDDPPWPMFNLPKIINNYDNIMKFLTLNKSPQNGLTLCTGSLGADCNNDLEKIVSEASKAGRVFFAHLRNIKLLPNGDFYESAHLSRCGDIDLFRIVAILYKNGFTGYIRPDHGRNIWGEQSRPGYGLYDRAMGISYIHGLWEAIENMDSI